MKPEQKYDPRIHHRRSVRLPGYDYSQAGVYFITVCCKQMKCRFGEIEDSEMMLNEFGIIAYNEWLMLSDRFQSVELDEFQIMPNHMHGIIVINEFLVGAGLAPALVESRDAVTIGDIVGAYKSLVTKECLTIYKSKNEIMGKLWQRDYYEHIISDDRSYYEISNYIIANPANWCADKFFIS